MYDKRPKMRKDAWMKVVFFPRKKTTFTRVSLHFWASVIRCGFRVKAISVILLWFMRFEKKKLLNRFYFMDLKNQLLKLHKRNHISERLLHKSRHTNPWIGPSHFGGRQAAHNVAKFLVFNWGGISHGGLQARELGQDPSHVSMGD